MRPFLPARPWILRRIASAFIGVMALLAGGMAFTPAAASAESGEGQAPTLAIRDTAMVDKDVVQLSDIFVGVPAGLDKAVLRSPPPGERATLDAAQLAWLAKQNSLSWTAASPFARTRIERAATIIKTQTIEAALETEAKAKLGAPAVSLRLDNVNFRLVLPAHNATDLQVEDFQSDQNGRFAATLTVAKGTVDEYVARVTGRIQRQSLVPVLARRMNAGGILLAGDITEAPIAENQLPPDALHDMSDLIGFELKRSIAAGEPLRPADLRPRRSVQKNSLVEIRYSSGSMTLTAQGRALADAAIGEAVSVLNTQSRATIEATVIADGQVSVKPPLSITAVKPLAPINSAAALQAGRDQSLPDSLPEGDVR